MTIRAAMACMVLGLAAAPAWADWSGKAELGAVLARGNTDSDTLSGKVEVANQRERWTHKAGLAILRSSADDVTTANRFELRGQSDYAVTERSYAFGALRYEDDEFSAFAWQATATVGYGYKAIDEEATKLNLQIGAGYRSVEEQLSGDTSGSAIVRGDVFFEHRLTATTRIIDKFLVEAGSDNTFVQNDLSLEVKMTDTLALGLSYSVRHNTDVPVGIEETDQVFTANLVWGF